jgi:hypothetical protein
MITPMMAPTIPPKSKTALSPMPSPTGEDQIAEQRAGETNHEGEQP